MKKTLLYSNIITLALLIIIGFHYKIPQKAYYKVFPKPVAKTEPVAMPKLACVYDLKYFEFHFQKENDNPKIIMFGNSLMRHGKWTELLNRKDVINRGISGDYTQCMCERLKYLKDKKAKIWFIEGGINDLTYGFPESIFKNYKSIIDFVKSENAIPVINLVFYLSPKAGIKYPERKDFVKINKMITKLNVDLVNYAKENHIEYIDLNAVISSNNVLKDEYTTDGVHLNKKGYKEWVKLINKKLIKNKI